MSHELQPAAAVLANFESNRALARILKVHPSALTRWKKSKKQGGTDGRIPQRYWKAIIEAGNKAGVTLTMEDLAGVL